MITAPPYRSLPVAACMALLLTACDSWWTHKDLFPIEQFVYERDAQGIFNIFDQNWYWLMPSSKETYSPDYVPYVFRNRAPGANPFYHNKLQVKVIRDNDSLLGFTAFYKKTKDIGQLLFLAVDEKARGKGLGEKLVRHALNELKKQNTTQINLVTRTDNTKAQRIYTKVGFTELYQDGQGFVYFTYSL